MKKILFFTKGIILLILIIISIDYIGNIMATREKVINLDNCGDVDIAFVGSSHVYRGINPQMVFDDTGMTSVNLATSSQTIKGSYWLLKAFLKNHDPQIVFVDVMPAGRSARDAFVLWPMHEWWLLKYTAYHDLKNEEFDYNDASQFLAFRTSYDNVDKEDWAYIRGNGRLSSDHWYNAVFSKVTPFTEEDVKKAYENSYDFDASESIEYLNKIIDLSIDKGFQVTFITAPYLICKSDEQYFSEVEKCCNERTVDFLNYNVRAEREKFDLRTDFADAGHLSYDGGEKYTKLLEKYILNQGYKHENNKEVLQYWENNRNHYRMTYNLQNHESDNLIKSLELISEMGVDYAQLFAITSDGYNALTDDEKDKLQALGIAPDFLQGKYCAIIKMGENVLYNYSDETAELYKNIEGVTCSIKLNVEGCDAAAGSKKVSMELGKGIGVAVYTISYDNIMLMFDC